MRRLWVVAIAFLLFAASAFAQIKFAWDSYSAPNDIDGFRLYQSTTSGSYTQAAVATILSGTTVTYTISQPTPGTYYWVLRAYKDDRESANSNEVSVTVTSAPVTMLTVTITTTVSGRNVALTADTNIPATMTFRYAKIYEMLRRKTINAVAGTHWEADLRNLPPNTPYKFTWIATVNRQLNLTSGTFTTTH